MVDYLGLRRRMISEQLESRDVRDENVLRAMHRIRRETFVPTNQQESAYADRPLPIGHNQTISQPYIVAHMVEALELQGGEKVLEIGAGSGYAAAVMAEIAGDVFAIERIGQLAERAAAHLIDEGYSNVHILHSDGTRGWVEHAPFDAILVSAGAPEIPETLKNQLKNGGRMVIPVEAESGQQQLIRIRRNVEGRFSEEALALVAFVPLISDH